MATPCPRWVTRRAPLVLTCSAGKKSAVLLAAAPTAPSVRRAARSAERRHIPAAAAWEVTAPTAPLGATFSGGGEGTGGERGGHGAAEPSKGRAPSRRKAAVRGRDGRGVPGSAGLPGPGRRAERSRRRDDAGRGAAAGRAALRCVPRSGGAAVGSAAKRCAGSLTAGAFIAREISSPQFVSGTSGGDVC